MSRIEVIGKCPRCGLRVYRKDGLEWCETVGCTVPKYEKDGSD